MPVDVINAVSPYPPIVDGFTQSASQLYLPTNYRASALAQMEALRRARSYRTRWYVVPDQQQQVIPAFDQLEYQVASFPGAYLWGLIFSIFTTLDEEPISPSNIHIQITDACTETPLFSDYVYGTMLQPSTGNATSKYSYRNPFLIQPRLLGQPAHLDVEIYNRDSIDLSCQLVLFIAEPQVPPSQMEKLLRKQGVR